jgi:hypothetical protein
MKFLQGIKKIKDQKTKPKERKDRKEKQSKDKGDGRNSYKLKLRHYKKSKQKQYR